ncbi:sepiapterin reductase isoform X2 [Anthonomus grandis grandis]|nr:sepiapterin reductase isoform X2 [Anthonomus grandis grandis]XP_050310698.1 sepiapterin reductase isoform X2 [Anthonomus grandis grandis]
MPSPLAVNFSKKSVVVITGASKGIGQTIATEISSRLNQNSILVLLARDNNGLDETKKRIAEIDKSLTVLTYSLDLSKPDQESYNSIFNEILETIDTKDIEFGYIFHNAGHIGTLKETTELTDLAQWRQYYDLNLFSAVLLNSVFIKKLRPIAPQLVVVNITSLVGRMPFANLAMYGSGKASREIFFKVLAVEQPKVTVLNYSPGPVLTDMFNTICDSAEDPELKKNFQETREKSVLTTDQTVTKLLTILEQGDYKSGDTIDYFDRI